MVEAIVMLTLWDTWSLVREQLLIRCLPFLCILLPQDVIHHLLWDMHWLGPSFTALPEISRWVSILLLHRVGHIPHCYHPDYHTLLSNPRVNGAFGSLYMPG